MIEELLILVVATLALPFAAVDAVFGHAIDLLAYDQATQSFGATAVVIGTIAAGKWGALMALFVAVLVLN